MKEAKKKFAQNVIIHTGVAEALVYTLHFSI